MSDREIKRIVSVLRTYIYMDANRNYSENLEVLQYVLRINEEYMENWVKDILKHESLWKEPESSVSRIDSMINEIMRDLYESE